MDAIGQRPGQHDLRTAHRKRRAGIAGVERQFVDPEHPAVDIDIHREVGAVVDGHRVRQAQCVLQVARTVLDLHRIARALIEHHPQ